MMQVLDMTHDERVAMYMKLPKKELVAMLMENQRALDTHLEHAPSIGPLSPFPKKQTFVWGSFPANGTG